jgi:hypothetical protein
MADRGSIGKGVPPAQNIALTGSVPTSTYTRPGPLGSGRIFSPAQTGKKITGTLKENGTPVAGRTVAALRKHDHVCLGTAVTDGSGAYSILCGASDEVYVVAFDPTTYQAIVYDQIIPV